MAGDKISFDEFGSILSRGNPSAQGFALGGSFAPAWTTEPTVLRSPANTKLDYPKVSAYPWQLTAVTETVGNQQQPRVKVNYGEVDGTAPSGMTQNTDYLLDIGNKGSIYLIITFNGNKIINSVTIGYGADVPDNTDTTKYMTIGSATLTNRKYVITSQEMTQYVFIDQVLYLVNNEGKNVYIDIPKDGSGNAVSATWREIDVCVNGKAKKMKVLGTAPY